MVLDGGVRLHAPGDGRVSLSDCWLLVTPCVPRWWSGSGRWCPASRARRWPCVTVRLLAVGDAVCTQVVEWFWTVVSGFTRQEMALCHCQTVGCDAVCTQVVEWFWTVVSGFTRQEMAVCHCQTVDSDAVCTQVVEWFWTVVSGFTCQG